MLLLWKKQQIYPDPTVKSDNFLQMLHPYVIDTSVIYNLSGDRTRKTGLRRLAAEFLE